MKQHLVERELTVEGPRRGGGVAKRRRSVTVNLAESPLGWLHARGHLDDRLFDAGERLRADYERAQIGPSTTMRWDPVRVKGGTAGLNSTERQIAAKARFDGAITVAGKGFRIFSGEWSALARPSRTPKGRSNGPPAAANWC